MCTLPSFFCATTILDTHGVGSVMGLISPIIATFKYFQLIFTNDKELISGSYIHLLWKIDSGDLRVTVYVYLHLHIYLRNT